MWSRRRTAGAAAAVLHAAAPPELAASWAGGCKVMHAARRECAAHSPFVIMPTGSVKFRLTMASPVASACSGWRSGVQHATCGQGGAEGQSGAVQDTMP